MNRSRVFYGRVESLCGLAMAAILGSSACTARALIEVDVTGDAPFQSVKLQLSASGTSEDFAGASFGPTMTYKAGLYVDASGTVNVVAHALDSSGNCIGAGTAS